MARMRNTVGSRGSKRQKPEARIAGTRLRDRATLLRSTALQATFGIVLLMPALAPSSAYADPAANARPQGGTVVAGSAAIVNSATITAINQSSQRAAINWTGFDVGSQQVVQFNQPNASSMTLNRVNSANPSQIAGQITANGTIILTNASGVVFSQGAQVNAQTLLVTTADISNQNFMAGRLVFDTAGKPNAAIINQGTISVAQSGLAALVAPSVANNGVINARLGTVILAGAATHTVDLYGDGLVSIDVTKQVGQAPIGPDGKPVTALVTNAGIIRADGGTILLTAQAVDGIVSTLVDAGGRVVANTTAAGKTGTIVMQGVGGSLTVEGDIVAAGRAPGTTGGSIELNATNAVTLAPTAKVSASGRAGGGTIALGTTLARASGGPTVAPALTAKSTTIAPGATVRADATAAGKGGKITVLSTAQTTMAGSITATGGKTAGDGGFVEVSGKTGYSLTGSVDVSAAHGTAGSILIDPDNLTISGGSTTPALVTPLGTGTVLSTDDAGNNDTVKASTLNALTGSVTLQAAQNLTVNSNLSLSATTLILQAGKDLTVNNQITFASGNGNLTLQAATPGFSLSDPTGALTIKAPITAGTGTITLLAGTGAGAITILDTLSAAGISLQAAATGTAKIGDNSNTGKLVVGAGGTISLLVDAVTTGNNGLVLTTGTGGVVELAPSTSASTMVLDNSVPGFGLAHVTLNTGTLRLGAAGGTVTAATLTAATAANLSASVGTLDLQSTTAINVTAGLTAGAAIKLATPTATLGDATHTGALVVGSGGTISVTADSFTGTATKAVLTAPTGVVELAPKTVATVTDIGLGSAATATSLGFIAGNFTATAGTLRLGSIGGSTPIPTTITVNAATNLTTAGFGTLDLQATGAATQAAVTDTLTVATLTGKVGSANLNGTSNAVATLGSLAASAGAIVLNDTVALSVPSASVVSASTDITLTDSFVSVALTPAITMAGTLGAPGTIKLGVSDATATGVTGLSLTGVIGTTAIATTTTVVDLNSGAANIVQSGGSIVAASLTSSGSVIGGVTLTAATNAISALGNFAVSGGDLLLTDSAALQVAAATNVSAGNITLSDSAASGAATPALDISGHLNSSGVIKLTVSDSTAGSSGNTGLNLAGTFGTSTTTLDLNSGKANIVQSAGVLTAGLLTSSGGVTGSVNLGQANAISTLGGFVVTGGSFTLSDASALVLAAGSLVSAANITISDSFVSTATPALSLAGTLDSPGVIKLSATDTTAATKTGISLAGTIGLTAIASTTTTLDLSSGSANIIETAGGVITAKKLLSTATLANGAALTLTAGSNAISTLGTITATNGDLALADTAALSVPTGTLVSANNITITDSFTSTAGTPAITIAGSLGAAGTIKLNASAAGAAGKTGIALSGVVGTTAFATTTTIVDLATGSANVVQTTGSITAASLQSSTGITGNVTLDAATNAIAVLGNTTVKDGNLLLTDSQPLLVLGTVLGDATGPVNSDVIRIIDTAVTLPAIQVGDNAATPGALKLATGGAITSVTGTIALKADSLAKGTAGGTLSASTGVLEVAPDGTTVTDIALSGASVAGTTLGFSIGTFTLDAGTLRLGRVSGVTSASTISVASNTDLSAVIGTLDLRSSGAVTQAGWLKVGTLTGSVGSLAFGSQGNANQVGVLRDLASTAGDLVVSSGTALSTAGLVSSSANLTLSDGFVSTATPALTIGGTLDAAGVIALSATDTTAAGNTGISLGGTIGLTGIATTATTLDVSSGSANVVETAGGVITAKVLFSSGGLLNGASLSLGAGSNAIAGLGTIAVGNGDFVLADTAALSVPSGTLVSANNITLSDSAASSAVTPALSVAGTLALNGTGTVVLRSTDATTSTGHTGIALSGTIGSASGTLDLASAQADITQTAGKVLAAVLTSTGGAAGAVTLTSATNSVGTLGAFATTGGDFQLTDKIGLVVNANVSVSGTHNLRLVDLNAAGVTLGDATTAGTLSLGGAGTLSIQADALAANFGGTLAAATGVLEVAPFTGSGTIALGTLSTSGTLGIDPAAYTLNAATLRLGAINGTATGAGIVIATATDLTIANHGATTLDLQTTGAVTQNGALTVNTLTGKVVNTITGSLGSITLMQANSIATLNNLVASGNVSIVDATALTVQGTTGLIAGAAGATPGSTLSLAVTGDLTLGGPIGNGGTGTVSLSTVTSGNINVGAGSTLSSGSTLAILSAGTFAQTGGLVNAPVITLGAGNVSMSGGTIAASSTIASYPSLVPPGISAGVGPSIAIIGAAFNQSGGVIAADGGGASVSIVPTSFTQSAGVISSNGALTIGVGSATAAGQLGTRAAANASFLQSGGTIAATGAINLWSQTTLTQSGGTIAAGSTLGATATGNIVQGNTAQTSKIATVALLSGTNVALHSITGSALQGGDGMVAGGTGASNDPTVYPVLIQAPAGSTSFSVFGGTASVTGASGFVVFCPSCNVGGAAQATPTISSASVGAAGATLADVVLLADAITPITSGIAAGRLALYSQHDTNGVVKASLLTGRAGILTQDASDLSPYPLPALVRAAETTSIQGTSNPYWSTAAAVTGNVTFSSSAVDGLGSGGFGYFATGTLSVGANVAPSGTLTVMGGQGATVYGGVVALGGPLVLTDAANVTVSGPVAVDSGTLFVTATSGDVVVNGSAVLSSRGLLQIAAAGLYSQSSGLVNAPQILISGSTGVLVSGGAIGASVSAQSAPSGAVSVMAGPATIGVSGGSFTQSGGTISATGAGASVTIAPSGTASQSAGVISSDGNVTFGGGSNAGLASGVATVTSGITQSGGTIVAAGTLTLYSTGGLTQSAGVMAAGVALNATAAGTISQGTAGVTSATTTIATISAPSVRLFSIGGAAIQGGDGLVAGSLGGAPVDPLGYPVRVESPNGANSFSMFGTAGAVSASAGYVVFSPGVDLTGTAGLQPLPSVATASAGATSLAPIDVVLLGDSIAPIASGIAAHNLALYSRHNTTGKVTAALLTGRAGLLTQDATDTSPYPLPDLVRAVQTAGLWSTTAATGNVSLTASAVSNLGTTGFGYGATGSFSLANASGGTLTVMGGQGATVYPGVIAWGGDLNINESGALALNGPVGSGAGNATLSALGAMTVSGPAAVFATQTLSLSAGGLLSQSGGEIAAPVLVLSGTGGVTQSGGAMAASAQFASFPAGATSASGLTPSVSISGGAFTQSGGTIVASGAGASIAIVPAGAFLQSGLGAISVDGNLTIGAGSNAGLASGTANTTTNITQSAGTLAATGNITLFGTGTLTQTTGTIAAGGTVAATAGGSIIQGNPAAALGATTAFLSGSTVRLFALTGAASQGGDGKIFGTTAASNDPLSYPVRVESPNGINSFSVFGTAASVSASAGNVVFIPSNTVTAAGAFTALPAIATATIGATSAALPDVVLLGDNITPLNTGVAAGRLALYSRHDTTGKASATLLTGRAGILSQDATDLSPFPLPDLIRAVQTAGLWSTIATPGTVTLTNGTIDNLGTAGFGYGATGGFSLTNTATSAGTLTIMGGQPGATVYPGVIAWGGNLTIADFGALGTSTVTIAGPVASAAGNLAISGQGTLVVNGLGVVSAAGTATLSTIGTYVQTAGLVNAPVVSISGIQGLTLSGGAIAASASFQSFPAAAGSASGLTPAITLSGGGVSITGGSVSAIGAGAQIALKTVNGHDFTQSAGTIFSGGDVSFDNGAGVIGTVSGAPGVVGGNFSQNGGTIAAAGNVSLWVPGALTQSAGTIAAGGTLGASAASISQGAVAGAPALLSGGTIRMFAISGAAAQFATGMVGGSHGLASAVDPLTYPVQIMSPAGANSFTRFNAALGVAAAGGYVVFDPAANVTAAASFQALPAVPGASLSTPAAALPDVVLLGDSLNLAAGASAHYLALYSRTNTTGSVSATLLTGRAGIPTQDATDLSPYPLPDIVRAVETAGFWSTAASAGNVSLTASAVDALGTITVPGTTGFGYGATGSFSLANTAPSGTLTVMGGGVAGSNVYPGVIATGGTLSLIEAGKMVFDGPAASSTTLSISAGGDLSVTQSAVLTGGTGINITTAGTYSQDSGLVNAPAIALNSTAAAGTGVNISGGTLSATGASGLLLITTPAAVAQSGGVIASDNQIIIGTGVGAGTVGGSATATSAITQSGGTLAAVGNIALYSTGALTQTAGVIAAGGTLASTVNGAIAQGTVGGPVASLSGGTVSLFSGGGIVQTSGSVIATSNLTLNSAGALTQTSGTIATSGNLVVSVAGITQGSAGGPVATLSGATVGLTAGAGGIVQASGSMIAAGDLTLVTSGAFTQTTGVIAAGGTLAATASGNIIQGDTSKTSKTTTVAMLAGSAVNLFSTGGAALQGGDGQVAGSQASKLLGGTSTLLDPQNDPINIQAPKGNNSFSIFAISGGVTPGGAAAANVTAGSALFSPASNLAATTAVAAYLPLSTYAPASAGATGYAAPGYNGNAAGLPDVVLLGNTITALASGVAANNLALYSLGDTTGNVTAAMLTGRAGVLTSDAVGGPDFVVPAIVHAAEAGGYWSVAANHSGSFNLPSNGIGITPPPSSFSVIKTLGTTTAGGSFGLAATGSIDIDNRAPGGTLTIAGPLMAWNGGIRINDITATGGVTTSGTLLVMADINVASPFSAASGGGLLQNGILSLGDDTVILGKAGGAVTLKAEVMEIKGITAVNVLDGTTLDTGGNTFHRPASGQPPIDPGKSDPLSPTMGAHFEVGVGGFKQTGTFTIAQYAPTSYTLSGLIYPTVAYPLQVLEIVLSGQSGAVAFDPTKGLSAPTTSLVLNIGNGSASGRIDADTLALFYTGLVGPPSSMTGTLRTALHVAVSDQSAATQAFIAQNGNYVPSNHFQMNGCALSSVNCVLTSLFPQIPVINPFRDLILGRLTDPLDDPDLLLPNVSDRDY